MSYVTPLISAAKNCQENAAIMLLDHHDTVVDFEDDDGNSALSYASINGHDNLVEILINYGAVVNQMNCDGKTPLNLATEHGHLSTVKLLFELGADINHTDNNGLNPLMYAILGQNEPLFDFLLLNDAYAGKTENKMEIYDLDYLPIEFGYIRIDADINNLIEKTPLILASRLGSESITGKLLKHCNIDVNEQILEEFTALMYASYHNHPKIVEILLDNGACPEIKDIWGKCAFDYAEMNSNSEIIHMLQQCHISKS